MDTNTVTIEFTREELEALKFWLSVIQFQGTRAQVRKPLEVYDAVVEKVEQTLGESTSGSRSVQRSGGLDMQYVW